MHHDLDLAARSVALADDLLATLDPDLALSSPEGVLEHAQAMALALGRLAAIHSLDLEQLVRVARMSAAESSRTGGR